MSKEDTDTRPSLRLIFKNKEQVDAQEIKNDSWNHQWSLTREIRNDLNVILSDYSMGPDYISGRSSICAGSSWDAMLQDRFGRNLKDIVLKDTRNLLGFQPKHMFWQSTGNYVFFFRNNKEYEKAATCFETVQKNVNYLFRSLDTNGDLFEQKTSIAFFHPKLNKKYVPQFSRED